MTNLNIEEWSPDQVAEWMSGLGAGVARYAAALHARGLDGRKLLTLRCDDLEYLGVRVIGHQELLLEAVEHLRNFHYELQRECVQQLALQVSVVATTLARALQHQRDSRLETQTLADVARTTHHVKPLVCWLDRYAMVNSVALSERKAELLKLSLVAATCAQRDRFAEQPTRAVALAAEDIARAASYILQDVSEPMILQPASIDLVTLQQGSKPLGFSVLPSFCGHHQLANIRFGSPAHACGNILEGDEIIQVGKHTVIGWSGEAVLGACARAVSAQGELSLRVRRRGGRARPPPRTPLPRGRQAGGGARAALPWGATLFPCALPWEHDDLRAFKRELGLLRTEPVPEEAAAAAPPPHDKQPDTDPDNHPDISSDESEPLSPPASPHHRHEQLSERMFTSKPRHVVQRRYSVSGGSPVARRPQRAIEQFWQELQNQKWLGYPGGAAGAGGARGDADDALYRRDKALSCSTGLAGGRPRTCPGVALHHPLVARLRRASPPARGKLDKSHSTPAYDFNAAPTDEHSSLVTQIIPESPTTPNDSPTIMIHSPEKADQILDFKKSSSQIGEAILQQQSKRTQNGEERSKFPFEERDRKTSEDEEKILETINIAMFEHQGKERSRFSTFKADAMPAKQFSASGHVKTIQDEIVQAINEQRVAKITKTSKDLPPEPPPRPVASQRPTVREPALPVKDIRLKELPVLKPVKVETSEHKEYSPLKPMKYGDTLQISVPLKHITKHDIQMIPNERRELPPLNSESNLNVSQNDLPKACRRELDIPGLTQSQSLQRLESTSSANSSTFSASSASFSASPAQKSATLSPTASVVRTIFPTSKSKSLKKKNSVLAKRRHIAYKDVLQYSVSTGGLSGGVWQRVRGRGGGGGASRWAERHVVLADALLLAYRGTEDTKAQCMIHLEGFTVSAASEVRSRAHAFKVYHTGVAFYFAASSAALATQWIQHLARATLAPHTALDESKQFSETDYSDSDTDNEAADKKPDQREKEKDKAEHKERDREKERSKFGSLKKLTHRMQRGEGGEPPAAAVTAAAASLDRKYLRFFSRNKNKDDKHSKNKHTPAPIPTEHYRSYRRVPPADLSLSLRSEERDSNIGATPAILEPLDSPEDSTKAKKIPKPLNYIHASNPNLLDFEKSDFVTKPVLNVPLPNTKKVSKPDNLVGFVTLEEFMLKKQEEERQQVYTNRVLMGIERDKKEDRASSKKAAKDLQKQLDKIIPDVIYGELPTYGDDQLPVPVLEQIQSRSLPKTPERAPEDEKTKISDGSKPVSIKGKDGYEKIVYTMDNKPLEIKDEPPKILPRKPLRSESRNSPDVTRKSARNSPGLVRKNSTTSAKDLGYEVIYDDDCLPSDSKSESSLKSSKDLGYETIYGDNAKMVSSQSAGFERRASEGKPPPRIMPKSRLVLDRQSSLTSAPAAAERCSLISGPGGARAAGVDSAPVFLQGDSPERFWLNSLRRNDKVHSHVAPGEGAGGAAHAGGAARAGLKSAAQYTPVTLAPPVLAALPPPPTPTDESPLSLSPSSSVGISRLRQMFGGGGAAGGAGGAARRAPAAPRGLEPARAQDSTPSEAPAPSPGAPQWALRPRAPPAHYPHLQCPPTFEPETYTLAASLRRDL